MSGWVAWLVFGMRCAIWKIVLADIEKKFSETTKRPTIYNLFKFVRQTDRETDRQMCRFTDSQTDIWTDIQSDRHTDIQTVEQTVNTAKDRQSEARAMVQWLRQTAHDQEVVGLNFGTVYWTNVSDASYYIHKIIKNKGCQMGHIKKNLKKDRESD